MIDGYSRSLLGFFGWIWVNKRKKDLGLKFIMEKFLKIYKLKFVDFFYDFDVSFLDIWNFGNNFVI